MHLHREVYYLELNILTTFVPVEKKEVHANIR